MTKGCLQSESIELTGVDGTNPLGFLCALGTLVAVRAANESEARLRWIRRGAWTPVIDQLTSSDRNEFTQKLQRALRGRSVGTDANNARQQADKAHQQARTAVKKEMDRIKKEGLTGQGRKDAIAARIAPLEAEAATKRLDWLTKMREAVPRVELALGKSIDCTRAEYRQYARAFLDDVGSSGDALDLLAAFGSDACLERSRSDGSEGRIEATPFCFIRGSGNQYFLDTVLGLLDEVTSDNLERTLFDSWDYRDTGLSMRWDPAEDKRYALMDAKRDRVTTMWMANLLAYRALTLLPCASTRRGLETTGWTTLDDADGETTVFTWPIWEFGATPDTVRMMLQLEELAQRHPNHSRLEARGITAVFRARRFRYPPSGALFKVNFSPGRAPS